MKTRMIAPVALAVLVAGGAMAAEPRGIQGDEAVRGVTLRNVKTGEKTGLPTDGVFIFIGHTPNTQLFEGQLEMEAGGYPVTDRLMRTNVPGVFAAGEAADPHYRQVITSAGTGAAAAIQANHFLDAQEH